MFVVARSVLCVGVFLAVTISAFAQAELKPRRRYRTAIELWRVGDDGLTLRFAAQFEADLRSAGFVMAVGGEARTSNTLVVRIPTHLRWEQVGSRTRATYTVEFATPDGRSLGRKSGSCWEDELSVCSKHAVRGAKSAAIMLQRRRSNNGMQRSAETKALIISGGAARPLMPGVRPPE